VSTHQKKAETIKNKTPRHVSSS